jgi:hypothetical protein
MGVVNRNWQRVQVRGLMEVRMIENPSGQWLVTLRCWDDELVANGFPTFDGKKTRSKTNALAWLANRLTIATSLANEQLILDFDS